MEKTTLQLSWCMQHPQYSRLTLATLSITSLALATLATVSLLSTTPIVSSAVAYTLLGISGPLLIATTIASIWAYKNRCFSSLSELPGPRALFSNATPFPRGIEGIQRALAPIVLSTPGVGGLSFGEKRSLPNELAVKIFEQLEPRQLALCSKVCRNWHNFLADDYVWQKVATRNMGMRYNTHPTWRASCIERVLNRRIGIKEPKITTRELDDNWFQIPYLAPSGNVLFFIGVKPTPWFSRTPIPVVERLDLRSNKLQRTYIPVLCKHLIAGLSWFTIIDDFRLFAIGPKSIHKVDSCNTLIFEIDLKKQTLQTFRKVSDRYSICDMAVLGRRLLALDIEQREERSTTNTIEIWDIETASFIHSYQVDKRSSVLIYLPEHQSSFFDKSLSGSGVTVIIPLEGRTINFSPIDNLNYLYSNYLFGERLVQIYSTLPPNQRVLKREIDLSTGKITINPSQPLSRLQYLTCVSGERGAIAADMEFEPFELKVYDVRSGQMIARYTDPSIAVMGYLQMGGSTLVGTESMIRIYRY